MAARRGTSRCSNLKLALLLSGSVVFAACQHSLPLPAPSFTSTPAALSLEIVATPLPTLTPRPTQPPTATPFTCLHLLTPENDTLLPPAGRVAFSWESMPDAALYWIEIRLPNGQLVTFDSTGSRDFYAEAFRLEGVYNWQVSAMGRGGGLLCTSQPFAFRKGK